MTLLPFFTQRLHGALPGACAWLAASLLGAIAGTPAMAADTGPAPNLRTGPLQHWVEQAASATWSARLPAGASAASDAADPGLRVEVQLGRLNPGLRLAACERIEPFVPPNARLWGRSHIGVRCVAGASWTTMLPVTVSVFGPALVANVPMALGSLPDPDNFRIEEVDWTRSRAAPIADPARLAGKSLGRPLSAGQVLHANDLRIPRTFSAGDPVQIRVLGQGFSVSATGFALAGAGEGESLRVRTEAGRMLVGTVRERTVEVRL